MRTIFPVSRVGVAGTGQGFDGVGRRVSDETLHRKRIRGLMGSKRRVSHETDQLYAFVFTSHVREATCYMQLQHMC
jgi:hypothetical protein